MNATQPPARKTPAHILAANQASRQRLKAAQPAAYKARTKEYNERAKEKRMIDAAEWEADKALAREVERYYGVNDEVGWRMAGLDGTAP